MSTGDPENVIRITPQHREAFAERQREEAEKLGKDIETEIGVREANVAEVHRLVTNVDQNTLTADQKGFLSRLKAKVALWMERRKAWEEWLGEGPKDDWWDKPGGGRDLRNLLFFGSPDDEGLPAEFKEFLESRRVKSSGIQQ